MLHVLSRFLLSLGEERKTTMYSLTTRDSLGEFPIFYVDGSNFCRHLVGVLSRRPNVIP